MANLETPGGVTQVPEPHQDLGADARRAVWLTKFAVL
jgi:hypothetical protein